ncbi:hypothetical protein [Flavisolibacter tropicus]|uniref:Uncharacterized protein n=1 Tax=Flavisolibacter tropicus TaxID=1492898 RepID=A0A172TU17_9BACT|nr:hypothetical protein [Flavisolibacter tropicus]ANE50530.1 hypothetical protein SY85_08475 [Flavisolibacter tropicus]
MAKQTNQYYIGRQGNLLYYQWRDVYCIRTKGTLDKKRFYEDKAFEGSRKRAVEFGEASKLAAEVYHLLPQELKKRGFIGTLTGWAHRGLMVGESKEAVRHELLLACGLATPGKSSKVIIEACTCRYMRMEPEQRYSSPSRLPLVYDYQKEKLLQQLSGMNEQLYRHAAVASVASG